MLTEIYNYIFGYITIKCNKCKKDITMSKKNYFTDLTYYCSNSCGYYNNYL